MQTVREIEIEIQKLKAQLADAEKRKASMQEQAVLGEIAGLVADAGKRLAVWKAQSETHARNTARLAELRAKLPEQEKEIKQVEEELAEALEEARTYPDSAQVSARVSRIRAHLRVIKESRNGTQSEIETLTKAV